MPWLQLQELINKHRMQFCSSYASFTTAAGYEEEARRVWMAVVFAGNAFVSGYCVFEQAYNVEKLQEPQTEEMGRF